MSVAAEMAHGATSIEIGDLDRLTVDQYEDLARLDVISDPRIELINGLLVREMTRKPRHSYSIGVIDRFLRSVAPVGWHVRIEQPARLPEHDLAVVRGKIDDLLDRDPGPADIALVEVQASASGELAGPTMTRPLGSKREP